MRFPQTAWWSWNSLRMNRTLNLKYGYIYIYMWCVKKINRCGSTSETLIYITFTIPSILSFFLSLSLSLSHSTHSHINLISTTKMHCEQEKVNRTTKYCHPNRTTQYHYTTNSMSLLTQKNISNLSVGQV